MTTEYDGVNWKVYRAELPYLPRPAFPYNNRLLARIRSAGVRLM